MAVKEERIDELIAVYKGHYKIDLTRDEAREICERIIHLFEGLKRSKVPPPEDSSGAMRS